MTVDWDSYINALDRYNIAIKKAKIQSWRKYCQGIDKIPSGARFMKILKSDSRNTIRILKRADGSFTMTGQETLKVLLETHFLDSKEVYKLSGGVKAIKSGTLQGEQDELGPAPTDT